jgi:hypothetical protein
VLEMYGGMRIPPSFICFKNWVHFTWSESENLQIKIAKPYKIS